MISLQERDKTRKERLGFEGWQNMGMQIYGKTGEGYIV